MKYNRKAFSKINNPKDLSLIRVFVKDRLIDKGIKNINSKLIKHTTNKQLEQKYWSVFGSSPTVDYLEYKRINREEGKVAEVYFIGNREYELVKIGFSTNVDDRVKALATACPFPIEKLASMKGSIKTEKELHRKFKGCRVNREWFKLNKEVEEFIDGLRDK